MISFAIQHHPARAALAAALVESIGGDVEVVSDPEPDGFRSPWRTYRHALERTPEAATYRVIIQDDALVCPRFRLAVECAVAAKPDRLVVLFVAGAPQEHAHAIFAASRRGAHWAELTNSRWTPMVAAVWPVRLIAPLLAFVDEQNWPVQFRADDEIVGRFMRTTREFPVATVPSLVQHPDEELSLIGLRAWAGQDPGRVACCFIADDCDAAKIDWAKA